MLQDSRRTQSLGFRSVQDIIDTEGPSLPILGRPIDTIRSCIQDHMNPKWGLLIYRCDYDSDSDWENFVFIFKEMMQAHLALFAAADLSTTLEITIKEDRSTLDGANADQVRQLFK
ncbi:hypothetical protein P171DRAFT_489100 [Karstenula rhodostoma CBS 690.94]|uniref:Uncharacterized protein n=1 Tax=Karstenula rhodostoma CBS 690.94 TaxID=1392251 RepID=A0A9P4PC54_9PLEO|nr:hypothetical protein P171DRAFT_489100 [Karstenula rhodostoma CBS 690.94]